MLQVSHEKKGERDTIMGMVRQEDRDDLRAARSVREGQEPLGGRAHRVVSARRFL